MGNRPLAASLLAVVALVTGCAGTLQGTARPDPGFTPPTSTTGPPPVTAEAMLGELRTVDPCALVDAAQLRALGTVEPGAPESFDYCRFDVTPAAGGSAALRIGELDKIDGVGDLASSGAREVPNTGSALRLFLQQETDSCFYTVLFTDLVTLTIMVDTFDTPDTPASDLCDLVDTAANAVVERLDSGKPVDHVDLPSNSIGLLDACEALSDATVTGALGQPAEPQPTLTGHQCRWGSPTVPSMSVRYVKGPLSTGPDVLQESIAGRATALSSAEITDRALCLAEVAPGGPDELAQVLVRLPTGQLDQACAAARTVAAEVWAALPT